MFDTVLVPIDGSETARRAAKVGLELAARCDAGVDLLVMASEGQTNLLSQRIGSTTRRVLQTVEQPVLVVPVPD